MPGTFLPVDDRTDSCFFRTDFSVSIDSVFPFIFVVWLEIFARRGSSRGAKKKLNLKLKR
jgi:hypothetical protein